MKIPDDELEELKSQSNVDNSRLEKLIKDMDMGFVSLKKQKEFLELFKKSQLFLPVVFSQNVEEAFKDNRPGEISVTKSDLGFNINYIELADDERSIPLFTSRELLESTGIQTSTLAVFMKDLANLLEQTDKYSFVSINPFTDLLIEMPINSFLALFNEMQVDQKADRDEFTHILKTQSIVTSHDFKVFFKDDENCMKNKAINGIFVPNIPLKTSSSPDFQKELKYTNIILVPKNKKILYINDIENRGIFDTFIAPDTEFEMVEEIDEFTTVWKIGKQPFYDGLDIESYDFENDFHFWFLKADDLIKQEKYEESLQYLDKSIELNPTEPDLWYLKGKTFLELNRYDEAIELLDKAFDLDPFYFKALSTKGFAYELLGRYDDAIDCYDEVMILDPNDDYAFVLKGTLYLMRLKDYGEAIKYLNQAKRINPKNSMTWSNLGNAYLNIGEFEKGLACCDKARSLDPSNFKAWFTTAELYYAMSQYEKAIEPAIKAKEISPHDSDLLSFIEKLKEAKSDDRL